MRVKILRSLALTVLTVICTTACSGCYFFGTALGIGAIVLDEEINDANKAFELVGEPTVSCVYNEETQTYSVVIDGVVKNISDKKWALTSMELVLYDEDSNVVGTTFDYCGVDVLSLETYRFYASAETPQEVTSVKLYEFMGRIA